MNSILNHPSCSTKMLITFVMMKEDKDNNDDEWQKNQNKQTKM